MISLSVASHLTILRFGRRMRLRGLYGRIWTTRSRTTASVPVLVRMGRRRRRRKGVHGRMEREREREREGVDSGIMLFSLAMGCASPRWSLLYSGGVQIPEQPPESDSKDLPILAGGECTFVPW